MPTDLLGTELTAQEAKLLAVYRQLKELLTEDGLAPSTRSNLLAAIAPLGVAVAGLGLVFEHLTDLNA
jgi:hypothetical protein